MIEVQELSRSFGDLVAVNEVSFAVRDGELTGFVGGNGAGKTTTMRMIMGILEPTKGRVRWQGRDIATADRARFGYMPEERGLYPKQPVLSQLIYFGQLHGMSMQQAKKKSLELLEHFGLADRAKDKLEKLSLGNQQRVQIAAAVLFQPEALILDEPFSGLDPDAVTQMHAVLTTFAAEGVPILFSSHQLELVEQLCDQIIILAHGKVVAQGTVEQLRAQGQHEHRIHTDADLGWLRDRPGVSVVDLDGNHALVRFADDNVEQQVLAEALARGPVRSFGPNIRPLSHIYREVTR